MLISVGDCSRMLVYVGSVVVCWLLYRVAAFLWNREQQRRLFKDIPLVDDHHWFWGLAHKVRILLVLHYLLLSRHGHFITLKIKGLLYIYCRLSLKVWSVYYSVTTYRCAIFKTVFKSLGNFWRRPEG